MKFSAFTRGHRRLLVLIFCLLLLGGGAVWAYQRLFTGLPGPHEIETRLVAPSIRITDRNGRLLYEMLPEGGSRHVSIPLEQIPQALRQATISTEDASFYTNPGVDLRGILRAVWINLRGGETLSGGSTITQQLARNLLMDPNERDQRRLRRKLRETFLAWQLAHHYSKDQILAFYLNQMYYGAFSYGVEAAAQTYFGKPAATLDLAESALLAGLTQAPGVYNPFTNPDGAKERQEVVLELMEKHGMINAEERRLAAEEKLVYTSTPFPMEAPHFVLMVQAELDQIFAQSTIRNLTGIVVRTTLDLDWQHHAEAIARKQLQALNNPVNGDLSHNVQNAALVALDPKTGEILALLGNPDYNDAAHSGAVNMALAPCQPGSALKPIIYAAAFDPRRPQPFTAATMLLDVRTSFTTHNGQPYVPVNYDRKEHGPVTARQALASSLNIPAVVTLNYVGLEQAINLASDLGISTFQDPTTYDLSLALGGGAVRLIELTAAYAAFDNGGFRVTPVSILEIDDAQGNRLYTPPQPSQPRVLDERVAWLITNILSDDRARSVGFGLNTILKLDRPAAAKTGTTTNFHDNWTIGYTPDLVVGVWVGNADYKPMHNVTGISGAGPIWHQFMRTVLTGRPEIPFKRPMGLVQVEVCTLSGKLPSPDCPYRETEWFIQGTQPRQVDDLYQRVTLDTATGRLADTLTPPERRAQRLALDLPPQAQPWARTQGLLLLSEVESQVPGLSASASAQAAGTTSGSALLNPATAPIALLSPNPNAIFRITEDTPIETQRIRLLAVGEGGIQQVTFYVDGVPLATLTQGPFQVWWGLTPGAHQAWVEAIRANGEKVVSEVISFSVR